MTERAVFPGRSLISHPVSFVCFLLSDENVLVLVIDRIKQFPVHTEEVYFQ